MKNLIESMGDKDDQLAFRDALRVAVATVVLHAIRTKEFVGEPDAVARQAVLQADAFIQELKA